MGKSSARARKSKSVAEPRANPTKTPSKASKKASHLKKVPLPFDAQSPQTSCANCGENLVEAPRALFVEEEVGRVFCSETCISEHFKPDIVQLEAEYLRNLSKDDLSAKKREELAYLRWRVLKNPDEVWREKTLSGDYRYHLMGEFDFDGQPVWSVCICLFLRGEPSFLYLAFVTSNPDLVERFRRGEEFDVNRIHHHPEKDEESVEDQRMTEIPDDSSEDSADETESGTQTDGLADPWTQDETIRAHLTQQRREDDIPVEEFPEYEKHIEEVLQTPDEVWSIQSGGAEGYRMYHFVRHYPNIKSGVWFIVVARETEDEEQIEILDAFPTRDPDLVDQYRCGNKEIDKTGEVPPTSRLVH